MHKRDRGGGGSGHLRITDNKYNYYFSTRITINSIILDMPTRTCVHVDIDINQVLLPKSRSLSIGSGINVFPME